MRIPLANRGRRLILLDTPDRIRYSLYGHVGLRSPRGPENHKEHARMEATGGFVPFNRLADELGVHTNTLRRRVRAAGVPLFQDPRDAHRRLLRLEDAEMLRTPQPAAPYRTANVERMAIGIAGD